jgi:membrane protein required for colicin V production
MYLDIFLIAVMLISGLLAMVRGFMREVLSIAAWGAAAIATLYAYSKLLPTAKQYFTNDYVAAGVTIGGVFLGTLIIVSILTVRISDRILDSRIGALDRTLGFLFGLARGLVIVVVAFVFFDWLVPTKSQPDTIRNAKSRVVLQGTGQWLMSLLPEDPENTILKRLKRKPGDEQDDGSEQRSDLRPGGLALTTELPTLKPVFWYDPQQVAQRQPLPAGAAARL